MNYRKSQGSEWLKDSVKKNTNEHGDRFPPALWLVVDKTPTSVRAEKREDPDNAGSSEQL